MIRSFNSFLYLVVQLAISFSVSAQETSKKYDNTSPTVVFQPTFKQGIESIEISPNRAHFITVEGDINTSSGLKVKLWDYKSRIMIASQFFGTENGQGSGIITLFDDGVFYLSLNQSIIKVDLINSSVDTLFTIPYPQFIHAYIEQNAQLIISTKILPENEGEVTDITNKTILYQLDCKTKMVVSSKKFDYEIPYLKKEKTNIIYGTNKGNCHFIDRNLEEIRPPIHLYSNQTPRFLHVLNDSLILANAALGNQNYEMEVGEGKIDFFDLKTGKFLRNIELIPNEPPIYEGFIKIVASDKVSTILIKPSSLLIKYGYNGIAEIPFEGSTVKYHDLGFKKDAIAVLSPIDPFFNDFFIVHGPVQPFGGYYEYSIVNLNKDIVYKTSKSGKEPVESVMNFVSIDGYNYISERSSKPDFNQIDDTLYIRNQSFSGGTVVICDNCNIITEEENPNWIIQAYGVAFVINVQRNILNRDTVVLSIKTDYETGYFIPNEPDVQILDTFNLDDFKDSKKVVNEIFCYFSNQDQYLVMLEWGSYENTTRALAILSSKGELVKLFEESNMLSNISFDSQNGIITYSMRDKKNTSNLHVVKWVDNSWIDESKLVSNLWEYAMQIDADAKRIYYMCGDNKTNFGLFALNYDKLDEETLIHSGDFYSEYYVDSKNAQLIYFGGDYLRKINLKTNTIVWEKYAEFVNDIQFEPQSHKVLIQFKDHSILFDENLEENHTFYFFENHSMVCYRSDGYYMSPGYAPENFGFAIKNKGYRFSQFDLKYNRPDLIMSSLNICPQELKESFKKAQNKRMTRYKYVENSSLHIPVLEITSEFESFTTNIEKVTINFQCKDSISELKSWNIWVNNIPLFGKNGNQFPKGTRELSLSYELLLSEGDNLIQIACLNEEGNESLRESFRLSYEGKLPPSKTYFIGIGIDHFKEPDHDLSYSVKDVLDLASALKKKLGNQLTIDTIFNENVTISNVQALKKRLLETNINDKVIISYSGHGLLNKEYDYYLSSYSVDFNNPEFGGIPYEVFEDLLDSIPARKKLLLIDACHSGEVDKEDLQEMSVVAGSNGLEKPRGVRVTSTSPTPAVGLQNSFQLMQELFVNIQKGSGATIISAAAGDQFALEGGKLENGFFTFAILDYMKKYDEVGINALKKYVYEEVERLSGGLQKPTSRVENLELDWKVW